MLIVFMCLLTIFVLLGFQKSGRIDQVDYTKAPYSIVQQYFFPHFFGCLTLILLKIELFFDEYSFPGYIVYS